MTAPARLAAYHALRALTDAQVDLSSTVHAARQRLADERDRALTADIVLGTLRWQRALDHVCNAFTSRPFETLDIEVRLILRLSVYQLLHLDRVPAAAVVDDAVDLARAAHKPSASGFVNAVLRAVLRQRHRLPLPERPSDPTDRAAALAYLGITHSHPEWLVARWLDRYGFDATETWVRFDNTTPGLTLRVNRLVATSEDAQRRLADDDVTTTPCRFAPEGLAVTSGHPFRAVAEGIVLVQDEASQLVPLTLQAHPGDRVLDLCAAPGGKTLLLAAEVGDTGLVVACDVRPRRLRLLRQTLATASATRARIVQVPLSGALPFVTGFDAVLVDAPCSGLGTLRRDPDIKWRRVESDLARLAARQRELLTRAAETVVPGGRLVYATCSSEPDENEDVVRHFLATRADFVVRPIERTGPLAPFVDDVGMFRTEPPRDGLEAFFAAVLERRTGVVRS